MAKQKDLKRAITLTKKQFKALLKAVYLGNWVANAYRDGSPENPHIKEYEKIEDYIFSLAPQFGLEKYMSHEVSDGDKYYPTNTFEETTDVHKLHEEYDNDTLFDELAERLGERDFFETYSLDEVRKMSREEFRDKLDEFVQVYHEEFEEFGIKRVRVNGKKYDEYN